MLMILGMLVIVAICPLIGLAINRKINHEKFLGIWIGLCVGIFINIVIICALSSYLRSESYLEHDKVQLVSLNNALFTEGDFFLGTGIIRGVPHYIFYYLLKDGGKQFNSLPATVVAVYEENRTDGYLVKVDKVGKIPSVNNWLIPGFLMMETRCPRYPNIYAMHVPKGTVKEGFNLDLSKMH